MCVCLCAGFCLPDQLSCGWDEKDCFTISERCNNKWDCRVNGGDERGCGKCVHCRVPNTIHLFIDTGVILYIYIYIYIYIYKWYKINYPLSIRCFYVILVSLCRVRGVGIWGGGVRGGGVRGGGDLRACLRNIKQISFKIVTCEMCVILFLGIY